MALAAVRCEDMRVPMRDGTQLAADLITVDDGVARPALLVRSAYSRAASRAAEDPVGLAQLGWAVVIQDVRGRFDSEGEFNPFLQEGPDGADTIAWCAAQPWCDGRVATWGASYLGATQLRAALERPPALAAMSPWVTSGWQDEGWTYEGGALQFGFVMPWSVMMAASDPRATPAQLTKAMAAGEDWDRLYRRSLGAHPARKLFPPFASWISRESDAHWTPSATTKALKRVSTPGFFVAGWFDIFCDSSLRTWQTLRDHAATPEARAAQRMVVGPWTHAGLFQEATPEMMFGTIGNGMAQDVRGEALRFLRACVDGQQPDGGLKVFVMGANEWREYEAWPPPSTLTTWFFDANEGANSIHGDGVLRTEPAPGGGRDTFEYNPRRPVPTWGGRTLGPFLPFAGPADQRAVEQRDDVLVYTSSALKKPMTIVGNVTATVRFATTAPSADVTVKLVDVHPDGRAMSVVDSVRRLTFTPGRPKDVVVAVGATALAFGKGHRIRVEISSSNFPRLDRNPSSEEHWGDATTLRGATQTVLRGGARLAHHAARGGLAAHVLRTHPGAARLRLAAAGVVPATVRPQSSLHRESAHREPPPESLLRGGAVGSARAGHDIHWGWESPTSMVRSHFVGHWMAAARVWRARSTIACSRRASIMSSPNSAGVRR